jgi:hypothetical protein
VNPLYGYTVYIKENGEYEPYLVLTNDYNGNTLLMRKYLLPEPHQYNSSSRYVSYYEDSKIDQFLNGEYKTTLDEAVQQKIVTSTIEILDKYSLGTPNAYTTTIERDVFLVSLTEIGIESSAAGVEGKPLKYFRFNSKGASIISGEKFTNWLRSATIWGSERVHTFTYDGGYGLAAAWEKRYVRPVFCVGNNNVLRKQAGIRPLRSVYVLD